MRYQIRHRLPHRIRLHFPEQLSPEQQRSIIWMLEHTCPGIAVRAAASGHGLVISSGSSERPLHDPLPQLDQLLAQPLAPLPEPPPQGLQRVLRQTHQGTLKLLMALAIAGWALPILPGTPFFVLAWWLGWRPESATANRQQNRSRRQGDSTRADRHDNIATSGGSGTTS